MWRGQHSKILRSYQVLGRELSLEQAEVVLVLESVEGGVEQVGGEGGHHATEEHLPREFVLPE